jgi:hypothetical protein
LSVTPGVNSVTIASDGSTQFCTAQNVIGNYTIPATFGPFAGCGTALDLMPALAVYNPGWDAPIAGSSWIGWTSNGGPSSDYRPETGRYVFQETFAIPANAIRDGEFHVFAGGDLNNLDTDRIDVEAGPFLGSTTLGTFSFPISDVHFTACENPPHQNTSPCPIPETVPGGMFAKPGVTPVGDVQGRRGTTMFNAGIPGLIVPQELLVADTNLQIRLFPHGICCSPPQSGIFDLYIDRLELRFDTAASPVPEPPTSSLVALGLAALVLGFAARRQRG